VSSLPERRAFHTGLELGKQVRHPWFVQHRESGSRISSGRNSVWITVASRLVKSLTRNAASCILLRIAHCTMAMPSAKVPGAEAT
jgi:hypothetical protein